MPVKPEQPVRKVTLDLQDQKVILEILEPQVKLVLLVQLVKPELKEIQVLLEILVLKGILVLLVKKVIQVLKVILETPEQLVRLILQAL